MARKKSPIRINSTNITPTHDLRFATIARHAATLEASGMNVLRSNVQIREWARWEAISVPRPDGSWSHMIQDNEHYSDVVQVECADLVDAINKTIERKYPHWRS